MGIQIKADATGKIAIYTKGDSAPNDDLPFTAPLQHLSRLRYHSDLNTPRIISTLTASVTIPARARNTSWNVKHTVIPHGRPGTPMVLGRITSSSLSGVAGLALAGSTPLDVIQNGADGGNGLGLYIWVTLGADDTNIVLHENSDIASQTGLNINGTPAITLNLTIDVFDILMDGSGAGPPGPGTDTKHYSMTPQLFTARRGAFRSDSRYLRAGASGATFPVPLGLTTEIKPNTVFATQHPTLSRYSCNGYVKTQNANGSTFTGPIQLVKK